jgi:hypothetical protein
MACPGVAFSKKFTDLNGGVPGDVMQVDITAASSCSTIEAKNWPPVS